MKERNKKFTPKKFMPLVFAALFALATPMTAQAIPVQTGALPFSDHGGMRAKVNGRNIYCINRGYPFRSRVSELQMVATDVTDVLGDKHNGTIASNVRYLSSQIGPTGEWYWFRGWGTWSLNGDHTDATQTSASGAPSSDAWQEAFDENTIDDEDASYSGRYAGGGTVRKWFQEVKPRLTGHEGAVGAYPTTLKKISFAEAGFNLGQLYAQAITQYYCWEDPDAAAYGETTKTQVKQALDWGIQYGFITTVGGAGGMDLMLSYKDSTGRYGRGASQSYSGSCDGYIRTTIGSFYDAMKLYRQVVWKTTNMRMIPSFASRKPNDAEPIKLRWDEPQKLYTATVSDQNGVLNYFDFSVPGCTVTNNGDGTLTISTPNQIGEVTSPASKSRLEPSDGVFNLPDYFQWDRDGKSASFRYTAFTGDYAGRGSFYVEDGLGRRSEGGAYSTNYNHSHGYNPACNWFCNTSPYASLHCTQEYNYCFKRPNCGIDPHVHDEDCYEIRANGTRRRVCGQAYHVHYSSCHSHEREDDQCHNCSRNRNGTEYTECLHRYDCPYYLNTPFSRWFTGYYNGSGPSADCYRIWCCGKEHYKTAVREVKGKYARWQLTSGVYATGRKLIDPELCYVKVQTMPHEFPAQTDAEILLIADNEEWNNLAYATPDGRVIRHTDHVRVGEKYHLKFVYSYKGASKGFKIDFSLRDKPYRQYDYLAKMQAPQNAKTIYDLRKGGVGTRVGGSATVPHAALRIEPTPVTIRGMYATPETAYTLNGAYAWDSGTDWNDSVKLDALTTDQYDDNYDNMAADDYAGANGGAKIASTNGSPSRTRFTVSKPRDHELLVVWEYDTKPEVFSSALVRGTACIEVGGNENYAKTYYDEAYNYAKDKMAPTGLTNWSYGLGDHNDVGGVGYFSSKYSGPGGAQAEARTPSHSVFTQNSEHATYAVRNKVWQSDVDVKVSNFKQNAGAGPTQPIQQSRDRASHDVNYNLYYTIDVENPKATIWQGKERAFDGKTERDSGRLVYDTSDDVNEFDLNTLISWASTGASRTPASAGSVTVVDHVKTGTTYVQREIPVVLATMRNLPKETMTFKVYPNHDRLVYEDRYSGVEESAGGTVSVSARDALYPPNERTAVSDIYPAMDPNDKRMRPQNVRGSDNVPDQDHQGDDAPRHEAPTTSFNIQLSDGQNVTVHDSDARAYARHDFRFNENDRSNRYEFPSHRRSIAFYKYSKTSYDGVRAAAGAIGATGDSQTESCYVSQILFKSNYTTKYKGELERKGARYVEGSWIDMANQNKFAIVSAGQGFELRVKVKYENDRLTQYLARYYGEDDAQNDDDRVGTQNQRSHVEMTGQEARQFCNVSALTGKDGRGAPYYAGSPRTLVSHPGVLDRLAVNLVTGSNVYNDLYCFMSDNPDVVYSYSGIYGTPVIFDRSIKYSADYSVTTVTYSMCASKTNGIESHMQKMKFYTNQLAPDKKTPGIVEGTYDVASRGEHSVTLWTPVVMATPLGYPADSEPRYIGDAIEIGYTIQSAAADDSVAHIVQ